MQVAEIVCRVILGGEVKKCFGYCTQFDAFNGTQDLIELSN